MKTIRIVNAGIAMLLLAAPLAGSSWMKIWGPTASVIVDGESGIVYAIPGTGASVKRDVYQWDGTANGWTALGKPSRKCVAAGWKPDSALYCITDAGVVYQYQSAKKSWTSIGGPSNGTASDLFGGPDQLLATDIGRTPDVYRWDASKKTWTKIGGAAKTFVIGHSSDHEFKLEVYSQSLDSASSATKGIYQWSGQWYKRGGPAGSIYVSRSTLFATNPQSGDILTLSSTGWKRVGGPGKMFAVDHQAHLYALASDKSKVYQWTGTPNQWTQIGGAAEAIFAGGDRLVLATSPGTHDLWLYRPACAAIGPVVPNFAGTIVTQKLKPISGKRKFMAILWDPQRPEHPAPTKASIEQILFGSTNSLKDWFRENSGGKIEIESAGVVGWYTAKKAASHYWNETPDSDPVDKDGDGFLKGHVEKWTEAIQAATKDFNFAAYDANGDKELTSDELGVFIVIPQNNPDGFGRPTAAKQYPTEEALVVQGVKIPWIVEWYAGKPPHLGTAAHELGHLVLDAPDMYFTGHWPYAAGVYSVMDRSSGSIHLDAVEKLKLGWLTYQIAVKSGTYTLADVETNNRALLLYQPSHGSSEYFLIENRWRGSSYDNGITNIASGLPMDGIAIWHVLEDSDVFDTVTPFPPTGKKGEWGRLGIRMIRANGGTPFDNSKALFNKKGVVVSDLTSPARLVWLDGTRTGFEVKLLSDPGAQMQLQVAVTCP